MNLNQADRLASAFTELFAGTCHSFEVAGSVRRRKPDGIKDLEIVCAPVISEQPTGLFGESSAGAFALTDRISALIDAGVISLDTTTKRNGDRYKRFIFQGVPVDFFIGDLDNLGYLMVLRTGASDFSHKLVTPRRFGGLLPGHIEVKGGYVHDSRGVRLSVPNESAFFTLLGIEWLEPSLRGNDTFARHVKFLQDVSPTLV